MTIDFYDFTAANGSAWPTGWTSYLGGAPGEVVDIQSNAGRLLTGTLAPQSSAVGATHYRDVLNPSVTWTWGFDNPIRESTHRIMCRASNDWNVGGEVSSTCYSFSLRPDLASNNVTLKWYKGGSVASLDQRTFAVTAGTAVNGRLVVTGTHLQFRLWNVGSSEPSTWLIDLTDTAISAAGRTKFEVTNGSTAQTVQSIVDTVTIDDQIAAGTGAAATARFRFGVDLSAVGVNTPSVPITPSAPTALLAVAHAAMRPRYLVTTDVRF